MRSLLLSSACFFFFVACNDNKENTSSATDKDTSAATTVADNDQNQAYFIDVHDLEAGKVTFQDVAAAHEKDLATQGKYGVNFLKYWVDEQKGKVYCLSKANDAEGVKTTHKEAHGLVPSVVYKVTEGTEAAMAGNKQLFRRTSYGSWKSNSKRCG